MPTAEITNDIIYSKDENGDGAPDDYRYQIDIRFDTASDIGNRITRTEGTLFYSDIFRAAGDSYFINNYHAVMYADDITGCDELVATIYDTDGVTVMAKVSKSIKEAVEDHV